MKLDALTSVSTSDPEGYLAHPVNAYKLMKRLNTEWSELESLVLQNPSDGKEVGPNSMWAKAARDKWAAIYSSFAGSANVFCVISYQTTALCE